MLNCVSKVVKGLGQSSASGHRDVVKMVKSALLDRSVDVSRAAADVRKIRHLHY